jgi:hypothetical protein
MTRQLGRDRSTEQAVSGMVAGAVRPKWYPGAVFQCQVLIIFMRNVNNRLVWYVRCFASVAAGARPIAAMCVQEVGHLSEVTRLQSEFERRTGGCGGRRGPPAEMMATQSEI